MDKLPKDTVIIQFMEGSNDVPAPVLAAKDTAELHLEVRAIFRRSTVLLLRVTKNCTTGASA